MLGGTNSGQTGGQVEAAAWHRAEEAAGCVDEGTGQGEAQGTYGHHQTTRE